MSDHVEQQPGESDEAYIARRRREIAAEAEEFELGRADEPVPDDAVFRPLLGDLLRGHNS